MRRVLWMAAIAAAVAMPAVTRAELTGGPPWAGAVTALSVQAAAGKAEVVIGIDGDVDVQDFTLDSPHRIVIDINGAVSKLPARLYDRIVRGGITNVRAAQFKPTVVRVVLDLDGEHGYDITRGSRDVRVSLKTSDVFEPWTLGAASGLASAPAVAMSSALPVVTPVVAPAIPVAPPLSLAQQQAGRRITVSYHDTDIREVLSAFSGYSGRSILPGPIQNVRVTAEIVDQPWEIALNKILNTNGLAATIDPNSGIITVDTYANLRNAAASEPLQRQVVALNYAKADELGPTIAALLSAECGQIGGLSFLGGSGGGDAGAAGGGAAGAGGAAGGGAAGAAPAALTSQPAGGCKPRGSVVSQTSSNSLIITETGSKIDSLVSYARAFDFKPQQVNIKSKIISINRTMTNDLGISYDLGSATTFFNSLAPRTSATGQVSQGEFQVALGGDAFAGVANAQRQFKGVSALNLIYGTTIGGFSLTSFLDALTQLQLADIQAEPSVNTVDKKQAEIFAGKQISFLLTPPTAPGAIQSQPPQISQLEVGVKLNVTPSISANRMVRLTITAELSSVDGITAAGPQLSKRNSTVDVIVRDGETAVIGGLVQTTVTRTRSGIPILMQLPMIGKLFSQTQDINDKNDLLILITPHILDDPEPQAGGRN